MIDHVLKVLADGVGYAAFVVRADPRRRFLGQLRRTRPNFLSARSDRHRIRRRTLVGSAC